MDLTVKQIERWMELIHPKLYKDIRKPLLSNVEWAIFKLENELKKRKDTDVLV
jgi:hypothetical protein